MAFWGNEWFVGIGVIGLLIGAVLFFTESGPFEQCVVNGVGAEFCGDDAERYCRQVSDQLAGRTAACNDILGEDRQVGSGRDPAIDALDRGVPPGPGRGANDPCIDPVTFERFC
jgi:hypothetical protein